MSEVKLQKLYRVDIVESERRWGSKLDEVKYFDNELEAQQFVKDYNLKWNNKDVVPDWYMVAEYRGVVT